MASEAELGHMICTVVNIVETPTVCLTVLSLLTIRKVSCDLSCNFGH
jgi:hypothetical protein